MGLFGKKTRLASNAPRHWPQVQVSELDPHNEVLRSIAVLEALAEGFVARGIDVTPVAVMQYRMFPEGLVEIHLEMEEAGKVIAVIIYPESTPEAAGHFAAVRRFLREKAGMTAVYYCPEPIKPAAPTQAWEPLDTRMFFNLKEDEDPMPDGQAALWWATDEDPRVSTAPALEYMTTAYEAFDGIEPWLFMAYVNDLQLTEEPPQGPVALPDEELVHPVKGPDGRAMFLCVSAEKGISFAFPMDTTPVPYRDMFLKHYAAFCQRFASELRRQGATALVEGDETPLGWWKFMVSVMKQQESKGASVTQIGVLGPG